MTASQLRDSANAPWTRTMVGTGDGAAACAAGWSKAAATNRSARQAFCRVRSAVVGVFMTAPSDDVEGHVEVAAGRSRVGAGLMRLADQGLHQRAIQSRHVDVESRPERKDAISDAK